MDYDKIKDRYKCDRTLLCTLLVDEYYTRSRSLADSASKVVRLEADKKTISSKLGAEIITEKGKVEKLSLIISENAEERNVECYWDFDLKNGIKNLIRNDTGEVVSVEDLTAQDRQMQLDEVPEKTENKSEVNVRLMPIDAQSIAEKKEKNKSKKKSGLKDPAWMDDEATPEEIEEIKKPKSKKKKKTTAKEKKGDISGGEK